MPSKITDSYYAYKFIRAIVKPWDEWDAYELGIIDESGNLLRKPKTPQEREAYNTFDKLTANVKRVINKLPGGKTKLSSFAAAMYLLKEYAIMKNKFERTCLMEAFLYNIIKDDVIDDSDGTDKTIVSGRYLHEGVEINIDNNLSHIDTVLGVRIFAHDDWVFAKSDLEKI